MMPDKKLQNIEVQALRPPSTVMRLDRIGSFFPTRLSFMRVTLRRLSAQKAKVQRPVWELDDQGYGRAVYSLPLDGRIYSLVAFSTQLDAARRSDRVIAEAWDASFALFDGSPTTADLDRLEQNLPLQEAGRYEPSELSISRANKSVRLFEHVVDRLANGQQPDSDMINAIGYLMRTTAVYGNGKLGFADRCCIQDRAGLSAPFQAEMLAVWLIREFTHDLADHMAERRNPGGAVKLARHVRHNLGIGNSTGLGIAPYLINHGDLMNNWMKARETALSRVRGILTAQKEDMRRIIELIERARCHLLEWNVEDARQMGRVLKLRDEVLELQEMVDEAWLSGPKPWDRLVRHAEKWSLECQEMIVALVLEPYGDLVDDLADEMASDAGPRLTPGMTTGALSELLEAEYDWALAVDFDQPDAQRYFWYTSVEKLEPRFGNRQLDAGAELELPLDIGRQAFCLYRDLKAAPKDQSVAAFLLLNPKHRNITRRVQTISASPYLEIRDNLIGKDCVPIDIIRCKLSFFGASKYDPKSELWTRINMYQGAPLADEIADVDADDWWLPVLEGK